eukprot:ANDGO_02645.mRNA.1 Threonylcarbamoyl-AMP synthase
MRIVPASGEAIASCAAAIASGRLVAFPTETVYGLGALASDSNALISVFKAKGRPLTDPLIAHVSNISQGQLLTILPLSSTSCSSWSSASSASAMDDASWRCASRFAIALANAFWPGPLTMVLPATPSVPKEATAGTGWIGIRVPRHPVALSLLDALEKHFSQRDEDRVEKGGQSIQGKGRRLCAICAPSANRFGHVSPTTAQHVYDDLSASGLVDTVLDGGPCEVGIESTVVKIDADKRQIVVLRRGGVSVSEIAGVCGSLAKEKDGEGGSGSSGSSGSMEGFDTWEVVVIDRRVKSTSAQAQEAPGGLVTHYAPDVPCYLISAITNADARMHSQGDPVLFPDVVFVDFGGRFASLRSSVGAYRDLSCSGSVGEAMQSLFEVLRWTELVQVSVSPGRSKVVVVVDLKDIDNCDALMDRIWRACSGRSCVLDAASGSVTPSAR